MHLSLSMRSTRYLLPACAALILAVTVGIYWPSLHGPYLLDDVSNLNPVKRWLDGSLDWRWVVLGNRSGPTGRPLSMLSFVLDAWRTRSMDSYGFKVTNLFIHLLCGAFAFVLIKQLLDTTQKARSSSNAWIALAVATIWLWLPIHVSTVAYVVQRMAQLSALWILVTAASYVVIRRRLAEKPSPLAVAALWVGVPLFAMAALLSKENGAVALPLVAVIEWIVFKDSRRPRAVNAFLMLTVGLPTLVVFAFLVLHPGYFSSGYVVRDFTMGERLLTEPRILWSYLSTSFLPAGSMMGIYHDNFPLSHSFWQPVSTLTSLTGWALLTVWAIAWRRKAPLFALGTIGYLVAHTVESGPIALEVYFEHRNYLPSVFALIGVLGLVLHAVQGHHITHGFRRLASASLGLLIAIYALSTWNQASAWSDAGEFYSLQYSYNPTSPRLLSVLTARAMLAKDLPMALAYIDAGERAGDDSEKSTATLWRVLAYCEAGTESAPPSLYDELESRAVGRITNFGMTAWDLLGDRMQSGCPTLNAARVAQAGAHWVERTPQDADQQAVWRTRYNVGRIMAAGGDLPGAEAMTYRAWMDGDQNTGVGAFLFQLSASLGHIDRCKAVLASLERSYGKGDGNVDAAVDAFRKAMPGLENENPSANR